MVEHQPSRGCLNGSGPRPNLGGLPTSHWRHHVAVMSPMNEVRALAIEDIPKTGMTCIAGSTVHGILAADLSGKQHAIAVIGQEGVFHLVKGIKVVGISNSYGGTVVAVAPGYIISIFQPANSRVIAVLKCSDLSILTVKLDALRLNFPIEAILASAGMDLHIPCGVVATEDSRESPFKRHHRTVEYAVRIGNSFPGNDRILCGSPEDVLVVFRTVFPGNVRQRLSNEFDG